MSENKDLFGNAIIKDVLLRDKFLEPPFTVLDTKTGSWQNRKRTWKEIGIKSHLGREGVVVIKSFDAAKYGRAEMPEASIFDPALCELIYNWFVPDGGTILDPFAGGSVRGIVAHYLGFKYTGIDIRPEQVESNREQAKTLLDADNLPEWIIGDSNIVLDGFIAPIPGGNITPIQYAGGIYIKREDLYNCNGSNGAKSRTANFLIKQAIEKGYKGVTTAGSRKSPQISIVAEISDAYNIDFVAHCPEGELGMDLQIAKIKGAKIIQHKAGYNSVIISRSREYAAEHNYFEIPFGMMCDEAVSETKRQVKDIPADVKRIVIPVGSGMNLSGLLWGLQEAGINIPVIGVSVGADPVKTLDTFAPGNWREMAEIVKSEMDYHAEVQDNNFEGIILDPIYEAKCLPYLQPGDLFWIIGLRKSLLPIDTPDNSFNAGAAAQANRQFDLVFSCPPYADLEVYSDLKGDISNKEYKDFIVLYESIIKKSIAALKPNGFAVFVVSDIRDKQGYYRDFVSHTKQAFIDSGARLYNEAILLQPLGTAMLRAAKIFSSGKKLTKVHENVLIFKKL